MAKTKTHYFRIRVTMDKPCTAAVALSGVRDTIHGTFYPYQRDMDTDPGEYRVHSITRLPKA